jgi:hypothetical protein
MRHYVAALLLFGLAGCSAGSSGSAPAGPARVSAPTTTDLRITIPRVTTAALRRNPAYISSSTQSIKVDVKPHLSGTSVTGYPIIANLTASSAGCTSSLTATQCDVALTLAPGNYDATLTTYDTTGAGGNALSAAQSMPLLVTEGQSNVVPLALGGIPTSVRVTATGGSIAGEPGLGFTIVDGASGTLSAFGVDAGGNTIVGAGAPAITAASDAGQIVVSQPTATAPNAVGIVSGGTGSIGHVTVTVTPVSGTGSSAVTRSFTVQSPSLSRLYVATSTTVRVYDATATALNPPGGFPGVTQATGLAYNPTNGIFYVVCQGSPSKVLGFDRYGNAVPLNAGLQSLGFVATGAVFDPANGLLYVGGSSSAYDASGNAQALSTTPSIGYGPAYDPTHNVIISSNTAFNANGTTSSTLGISGQVQAVTYNPVNQAFYVATAYPTAVASYTTSGVTISTFSGLFAPVNGAATTSVAIAGIAADPQTGNVFLATNTNHLYGYDAAGNPLAAPWSSLPGAPSDVAGMVLVAPQ